MDVKIPSEAQLKRIIQNAEGAVVATIGPIVKDDAIQNLSYSVFMELIRGTMMNLPKEFNADFKESIG